MDSLIIDFLMLIKWTCFGIVASFLLAAVCFGLIVLIIEWQDRPIAGESK